MVINLVKSQGIPAFACPSSDISLLWPCSLVLLHSEPDAQSTQFSALLKASVPIHGVDGEQSFVLCFDGDKLVPGRGSLGPVNISLAHECMNTINREDHSEPRMLSLTLREPCSVRYPRALGTEVARFDTPCRQLVALANATEIHILFDSWWLRRNRARLQSALRRTSRLDRVPVLPDSVHAVTYVQAPCSILYFVTNSDAALPSIETSEAAPPVVEDALDDAPPPPYAHAPSKRPRYHARTPTPDRRLSKRILQELPPSPTERASSPAAKPPASSSSNASTVQLDTLQDAINSAVETALPAALRAHLPSILAEILPGMLVGPPSVSSSPTPSISYLCPPSAHIATAPTKPPPPPTPASFFRTVINTHIHHVLDSAINSTTNYISDQASDIHAAYHNGLSEDLEDHRLDMAIVKEDQILEFERHCEGRMEDMREGMEDIRDRVEGEVEDVGERVVEGVRERVETMQEGWCRCRCRCRSRCAKGEQEGRRAISLPL